MRPQRHDNTQTAAAAPHRRNCTANDTHGDTSFVLKTARRNAHSSMQTTTQTTMQTMCRTIHQTIGKTIPDFARHSAHETTQADPALTLRTEQ